MTRDPSLSNPSLDSMSLLQSPTITKLVTALINAQQNYKPLLKTAENPYFHSKYATLPDCMRSCKDALAHEGLTITQREVSIEGEPHLLTQLLHLSGEWLGGFSLLNPDKDTPQGMGSALTYARRYALCGMVGLAPDEDDDGNSASGITETSKDAPRRAEAAKANPKVKKVVKTLTAQAVNAAKANGWQNKEVTELIVQQFGVSEMKELSPSQVMELIKKLNDRFPWSSEELEESERETKKAGRL